ncbi:MAG: hypothetical protein V4579_13695 [Pseudomonadota bacterium]
MQRYRFVTPHRAGKWYPDLETAQRHAFEIGAGFLAERSGEFCAYRETRLEVGSQGVPSGDTVSGSDIHA